jgi:internalin A
VNLGKFVDVLNLPHELKNESNDNILSFLQARGVEASTVFRVKVLVLGPGEAGKTTLVHRFCQGHFQEDQFGRTDGVLMQDFELEDVIFSFWDFGGQEIYLNSHTMFMSDKTVFMVVWNQRASETFSSLECYFHAVRSRAPDAPILLVSSRADASGSVSSELLSNLTHTFCSVPLQPQTSYYAIDSKSGNGFSELRAGLVGLMKTLPYTKMSIPQSYKRLENDLMTLRKTEFSLSAERFHSLASSYKIENSDFVLNLFDSWGVVRVLGGGDVVLEPQRLADVFARVVSCHEKTVRNRQLYSDGVIRHGKVFDKCILFL